MAFELHVIGEHCSVFFCLPSYSFLLRNNLLCKFFTNYLSRTSAGSVICALLVSLLNKQNRAKMQTNVILLMERPQVKILLIWREKSGLKGHLGWLCA